MTDNFTNKSLVYVATWHNPLLKCQ